MNPLVSVIVPIYNTEEYLPHCIDSILNQTYGNIEVILVDDGSTDKSLEICKHYALKDTRIAVIGIRHQGLVTARKAGVENSQGEYCIFVDSDDWIAENLLETVVPLTDSGHVDIVNYNMRSITEYGYFDWKYTVCDGLYENEELKHLYTRMIYDFEQECPGIIQSLCTKLIKRSILWKNVEDVDNRITWGEDAAVVYTSMLDAEKVMVSDTCLYFYRSRPESMCFAKNEQIFSQIYYFQQYMISRFSQYGSSCHLEKQLQAYTWMFIRKGIENLFELPVRSPYHVSGKILTDIRGRVVLYGAGGIGKAFYRRLIHVRGVEIVAWVDRNLKNQVINGCKIEAPDILNRIDFDRILIAIKDPAVAKEIEQQLRQHGFRGKILWAEPETDWREIEIVL